MFPIRQATADKIPIKLLDASGNPVTGIVAPTITLSKDGAAFAALSDGTWTELAGGHYTVDVDATDTDTVGSIVLRVIGVGFVDADATPYIRARTEVEIYNLLSQGLPLFIGKTYYVDATNGNDSNDGLTPDKAFLTVTKGLATVVNYDRIKFAPGLYTETGMTVANRIELIGGQGVRFRNLTSGYVITVNEHYVRIKDIELVSNGSAGGLFLTSANWLQLDRVRATNTIVGFKIEGQSNILRDCASEGHTVTGYEFKYDRNYVFRCTAEGRGAAVIGFDIIDYSLAKWGIYLECVSSNNNTAGWRFGTASTDNVIVRCASGGTDGAKTGNLAGQKWIDFGIGSQISAGQSREEDTKDIYDEVMVVATDVLDEIIDGTGGNETDLREAIKQLVAVIVNKCTRSGDVYPYRNKDDDADVVSQTVTDAGRTVA